MNLKDFTLDIFPRLINYKLARLNVCKPTNPITLTFSITAACNSLCKTCNIGKKSGDDHSRVKEELNPNEIEKFFKSLGHVYFFNISGGEPYLKRDFVKIIDLALKYLSPKIIHTPTNALLPERIYKYSWESLELINKMNRKVQFSVKPSIDGIGDKHDEIRGIEGNFKKLEETIKLLKKLEEEYANFHLELGTVVSKFNINNLDEIEDYVHSMGVQSYRNELAEQREEFFNIGEPITPSPEEYKMLMERFKEKIRDNIKNKKELTQITEALRLVYYDLATEIIRTNRQVIPCYGGISNVHVNYDGEVWPCCVIGYKKPLGNLRDHNYDLQKVWHSRQAKEVRKSIKEKECACPLANQSYSNILCNFSSFTKAIVNMIAFKIKDKPKKSR